MIRARVVLVFLLSSLLLAAAADKGWMEEKPFESWSAKDAENLLRNSPWTKTFSHTPFTGGGSSRSLDSSRSSAARGANEGSARSGVRGGMAPRIYMRVHWLSARPVRMAFARRAMALNPNVEVEKLREFASAPWSDAVLSVTLDSNDEGARYLRMMGSAFQRLKLEELNEEAMLVTKGGKEARIKEYLPPRADGLGAQFVFARTLPDGRPLLEPEDREAVFSARVPFGEQEIRLSQKFKLEDMTFAGRLEY